MNLLLCISLVHIAALCSGMAESSKWTGVEKINNTNNNYELIAIKTSDFDTIFLQDG